MEVIQMEPKLDLRGLIENHQAGLWRYLRLLGCEDSKIEDLMQETFITAWKKPFKYINHAATSEYLRKISYNLMLTATRSKSLARLPENPDRYELAWRKFDRDDNGAAYMEALQNCMQTVKHKANKVLNLKYRENLSLAEISASLGMSGDGVKTLLRRTKSALRQCIERKMS
ncbi:RNA polymerase sigma factor [Planctomycetota bacterium]